MILFSELGTRKYSSVATRRPSFQATKLFVVAILLYIFGVATPSRHRDLNHFRIFSGPWGSITFIALSLSRSYKIVACPALLVLNIYYELLYRQCMRRRWWPRPELPRRMWLKPSSYRPFSNSAGFHQVKNSWLQIFFKTNLKTIHFNEVV